MTDIKQKKKEAAEFLGRKGRRIEIIFFGLLLTFVSIMPIYLCSYIVFFFEKLNEYIKITMKLTDSQSNIMLTALEILALCISILFVIFLTFPVFSCFFKNSYKIYRQGIAGERKHFELGEHGYFGAVRSGAVIFGIFALCLVPVTVFVEIGMNLAFSTDKHIAALIEYLFIFIIAAGLVLGFLIFLLFKPLFLFGYYTARGKTVREALKESVTRMRSPRAKQIYGAYIKTFLPSLLLSVATVLVFFLLDTLPKMSMVYFDIADDIVYGKQQ